MKKLLLCLCLILTLAVSACANNSTPPATGNAEVMGTVNGEDVYQYEYDFYFNMYFNEYFSNYYDTLLYYQGVDMLDEESAHDLLASLEQYAWDSVVQSALIRQMAASDYNLSLEPSYMDEILLPAYRIAIGTNRLYSQIYPLVEQEAKDAKQVSEEEAQAAYDEDPSAWDSRQVAHIIFTATAGDEAAMAEAKTKAEDIIDKLNSGEDFAELAKEYSQDGAAANGGAMELYFNIHGGGVSEASSFDGAFAAGAFEIDEVGGYSAAPVESSFGYHVIKVLDEKKGFEAVKDYVYTSLQTVSSDEVAAYFQQMLEEREAASTIELKYEFKYNSGTAESEEAPAEEEASS